MFVLYIVSIKFKHLLKREKKSHKKFSFLYAYPCNQYRLMHIKLGKNLIQQQQKKFGKKPYSTSTEKWLICKPKVKRKKKKKQTMKGKQQEEEGTVNG